MDMKRRIPMSFASKFRAAMLIAVATIVSVGICQTVSAQEGVFHVAKGVVKSVDKGSKTMVVKTADGTEHTIKWTDKTTVKGGKDVGDSIAEGSKVSVKYSEKGGEKTAVGVKDLGKGVDKAAH
jgi:hypothetical protein